MTEITGLKTYPVKSLQGIDIKESTLGVHGLEFDRRWMVTDSDYNFVTQRQIPGMASIGVDIEENSLILHSKNHGDIRISRQVKRLKKIKAKVWSDLCSATDEGDKVSAWLTLSLGIWKGKALRLVRFEDGFIRSVSKNYLRGEESYTAFSDGFPYLIASTESLVYLNAELKKNSIAPITMDRFRANIIIKGLKPFEEFELKKLASDKGKYSFGLRKPCRRCRIITIDQHTGVVDNLLEPISTLKKINPIKEKTGAFFGQNSILITGIGEKISIGDKIEAIY